MTCPFQWPIHVIHHFFLQSQSSTPGLSLTSTVVPRLATYRLCTCSRMTSSLPRMTIITTLSWARGRMEALCAQHIGDNQRPSRFVTSQKAMKDGLTLAQRQHASTDVGTTLGQLTLLSGIKVKLYENHGVSITGTSYVCLTADWHQGKLKTLHCRLFMGTPVLTNHVNGQ